MKKNAISLSGFFVLVMLALFSVSCDRKTGGGDQEPPKDPKPAGDKPEETITLERAHDMYRAYQARYDALTEFREGKEDARYGWHSIDFYKNYIAYLEKESKKAGIPVSGLRLYYVAYPEDEQSKDHAGYQTYIFVPTYYNKEADAHVAFDPLHIGDDGKPLPIHDIIVNGKRRDGSGSSQVKKASFMSVQQIGTESSIANYANMCEPNCSTAQ